MDAVHEIWDNPTQARVIQLESLPETKGFRVHLVIIKDGENEFSAIAWNLPGAGSCGATVEEAVDNAIEAVKEVLESYEAAGAGIPWKDRSGERIPFGAEQKWIIVHA
jgi:predicted RNase H-like HicB family nuclease